jgi:hypothetical protein
MPDGWPTFRNQAAIQCRSEKMDKELQRLQHIAAYAGAPVLLEALLSGTGAIC